MLTEICAKLNNYFSKDSDKAFGKFSVSDGKISPPIHLEPGQYYRVCGSIFNDGVHQDSDVLIDEPEFDGAIWKMRVPADLIEIAQEMAAWNDKYSNVDSPNMSPYSSESFGGYTYSKAQGYASTGGGMLNNVFSVYDARLAPYRKIRI